MDLKKSKNNAFFYFKFILRAPFTIQRICELTLDAKKFYKSSKKILFAFEKVLFEIIIKLLIIFF